MQHAHDFSSASGSEFCWGGGSSAGGPGGAEEEEEEVGPASPPFLTTAAAEEEAFPPPPLPEGAGALGLAAGGWGLPRTPQARPPSWEARADAEGSAAMEAFDLRVRVMSDFRQPNYSAGSKKC